MESETRINNEKYTLIMNATRDKVRALDACGIQVAELSNDSNLYLMYLQKHPIYGLCVVASVRELDNHWEDVIISIAQNEFKVVSKAR